MSGGVTETDRRFMAATLRYARRHQGQSWPNPCVGALIVQQTNDQNIVVGRGITASGGRPHAETLALSEAGSSAKGATCYVTLEPCSHHGKTGPCAEALVKAGVCRVVCALEDPDPQVSGAGFEYLKQHDVEVVSGVCASEAREDHIGFLTHRVARRPALTLKLALSKNRKIGKRDGAQIKITGDIANRFVHMERARHDGVMVGIGTVINDNPLLTARLDGDPAGQPQRIVLDRRLRISPHSRLIVTAAQSPVWILCDEQALFDRPELRAMTGVTLITCEVNPDGGLSLPLVLEKLAERGITRLFCEGGATIAGQLVKNGLVDRLLLLQGQTTIGEEGVAAFSDAIELQIKGDYLLKQEIILGNDVCQDYRLC